MLCGPADDLGCPLLSRERVLRGLDRLEELWAEKTQPEDDLAWRNVRARLQGQAPAGGRPSRHGILTMVARMSALVRATGIAFGTSVDAGLPPNTVYLNVGQITLPCPSRSAGSNGGATSDRSSCCMT